MTSKGPSRKVPGNIKDILKHEAKVPQLAELAGHFFQQCGGPRQVARMLYEEFVTARPGSQIRQRILEMVLRVTRFANEQSGPTTELGLLSEEDLQREVQDLLGQVSELTATPEAIDATPPASEQAETG